MTFPVVFDLGFARIAAHPVFELAAYALGFQLLLLQRRKRGDVVTGGQRLRIVAAAILGAALGSKLLHHLNHPSALVARWQDPVFLLGGKTIVGGLLGGLVAVEWMKRRVGVTTRTGDMFVWPLCLGIAIGRIGCFLTGVHDDTHGSPTSLFLGMDAGDGIARHPAPLYEIGFLGALALWLKSRAQPEAPDGRLFQHFMLGYLGFRVAADFLKPGERWLALTAIQWAALGGSLYYAGLLRRTAHA
ncbi:MAG: prolipoprotein diacylglyceryl transferase [Planctomycetota bacterium]|nr:prolipoprotein diacylglyceryl transferase [Planctomycetota bacterium]